jgi:hypothetical protein
MEEKPRLQFTQAMQQLESRSPVAVTRALHCFADVVRLLTDGYTGRITLHAAQGQLGDRIEVQYTRVVGPMK